VADWSNPIIQHGEVDFRDPRRDKVHGRIWRIAAKGRAPLRRVDFTKLANTELLDRLNSGNAYDEEHARRVLIERGAANVLPDLATWTAKQTAEPAKLQALWMYEAFDVAGHAPQFDALLKTLLAAHDARVRAAAVRAMPASSPVANFEKLVADENPRVRLEAVRALGQQSSGRAAELALSVLDRPMDPFLDYALWLTVNDLAQPWLAAVKSGTWAIAGREKQLEFGLKAVEPALASDVLGALIAAKGIPSDGSGPWIELIGAAGGSKELRALVDDVVRGALAEPAAIRALQALADAARLRGTVPAGDLAAFGALLDAKSDALRVAAIPLVGTWKLTDRVPQLAALARNPSTRPAERTAAFAALRNIAGPAALAELKNMIAHPTSPDERRDAVLALAALDLPAALPEALATLKSLEDDAAADAFWRGLLAIRGAGAKLANELPKTELPVRVARAGLRPAREGAQNQSLVQVLSKIAGLPSSTVQLSPAELQTLAREALAKGNAARGEKLYRRPELACVACHAIGGAGGKVGPDLTSIGASAQPDYLFESVLYPNAKIKEGYHSMLISTKDNQELSGMIVKETVNEIVLRDASNKEVSVAMANVARRTSVGSLMPAGLVDTLLPDEQLDLVKFLSSLGKPGDYDASKGGVARVWRVYQVVSANQHLGVEPVVRGDFSLADWVTTLSLVNGTLSKQAIAAAVPPRGNSRGLFTATRFQSAKGGAVHFTLSGAATGVWVNGEELPAKRELNVTAKPGLNTIVIQLDETKLDAGVKLASGEVTFVME
jgi:putative heme-binding domain-containing protein